jgi:predicted phage terminase large subunit-like protein
VVSAQNKAVVDAIKRSDLNSYKALSDLLDMAKVIADPEGDHDLAYALKLTNFIKRKIPTLPSSIVLNQLYWQAMKFEAPHRFESFLLYMEKNRFPKKRFYQPRAKTLHVVVEDLQDLEDGLIEFYGLSLPPRVGKSTVCIFFLAWCAGRHPDLHNAMGGHSGILAKGFYKEFLNLITSPEYTYNEIFPNVTLESKSSDEYTVNLNDPDRFATLTCRGIDGTWTGAVDISAGGYLYVDDLIRDRTESLSPIRLENRYQDYLNVMVDRKNDGAKELMVGTRWCVADPLGRNEEKFKGNPKARFRKIPALNEKDESNFNYDYGLGFSTEYYKNLRDRLDKNEWMAKYQQRPFVREGLIFPIDELEYYNGVLPDGDCITAAACDVAWGGGDSLSMPFGKLFGSADDGPIYIPDWIFNKGDKYVTKPLVVAKTMQQKPNIVRFEANNGGDEYAEDVDRLLRDQGYKTNISWAKASNQVGKMAKIIQYAPDIKRRFRFLKPELQSDEYKDAMEELGMLTQVGKNEHEDSADGLVQLFQLFDGGMTQIEILSRAELGI